MILGIGGAAGTGKISNRKVLYSLKLGWTHEPYTTIASPLKRNRLNLHSNAALKLGTIQWFFIQIGPESNYFENCFCFIISPDTYGLLTFLYILSPNYFELFFKIRDGENLVIYIA